MLLFPKNHPHLTKKLGSSMGHVWQAVLSYGYYGNSDITAAKFSEGVNPEMVPGSTRGRAPGDGCWFLVVGNS